MNSLFLSFSWFFIIKKTGKKIYINQLHLNLHSASAAKLFVLIRSILILNSYKYMRCKNLFLFSHNLTSKAHLKDYTY